MRPIDIARQITPPIIASLARRWILPLRQHVPRGGEFAMRDGVTFRLSTECWDGIEQFRYGDPALVKEMEVFLGATAGRRRLLDVGACHGAFSLSFCAVDPSRQAVAVEPSPIAMAKLLYNVHANKAFDIRTIECALSDR